MNIYEFFDQIDGQSINLQFIEQIEQLYEVELSDSIKKTLSVKPEGEFIESDDILRLLSHEEILDASQDLSVDFIKMKLIPILDTGDNDYIVFDLEGGFWYKFNIVDAVKYKQRQSLTEYFRKK